MDEELIQEVERARAGEREAFAYLAAALRQPALRMARSILVDPHQAEDAVQEAWLIAQERIAQLRTSAAFPGWLLAIVRREAQRIARRRPDLLSEPARAPDPGLGPEGLAEGAEVRATLRSAVAALPGPARVATERFYLEGLSVKETAAALGVPEGTVKRRLHDARQTLRSRLVGLAPRPPLTTPRTHAQPRTQLRLPL